MVDRRCCCLRGCTICEDSFDRPNSASILPFIEESGTWSIEDGMLKEAGGNDGIAYCPTPHPVNTSTAVAWVTLKNMQEGDEYVLFVNHTPETDSFEGIKLVCDTEDRFTISIVGVEVGDSKTDLSYVEGEDLTLRVCRSTNGIYAGTTTHSWWIWNCVEELEAGRRYAGVQNPGNSAVYFDDFVYQEHYSTNEDCQDCACECDGQCLPTGLTLTLQSTCEHRDGIEVALTLDTSYYSQFVWTGEALIPDPLAPHVETLNKFRLYCTGINPVCDDENQFWMCTEGFQHGQCSTVDWGDASAADCTPIAEGECSTDVECDPLVITFGPSACTGSPPPTPPLSCVESLILVPNV